MCNLSWHQHPVTSQHRAFSRASCPGGRCRGFGRDTQNPVVSWWRGFSTAGFRGRAPTHPFPPPPIPPAVEAETPGVQACGPGGSQVSSLRCCWWLGVLAPSGLRDNCGVLLAFGDEEPSLWNTHHYVCCVIGVWASNWRLLVWTTFWWRLFQGWR